MFKAQSGHCVTEQVKKYFTSNFCTPIPLLHPVLDIDSLKSHSFLVWAHTSSEVDSCVTVLRITSSGLLLGL